MFKVNLDQPIKEVNIEQVRKESEIRYGDRYSKPEPLINYIDDNQEYPYLTNGGISAILGEQKSRKTFYKTLIMCAALTPDIIDNKLKGHCWDKNHLWFDTEQSKYYASMIPYRIVKKLDLSSHPQNFTLVSIKKYTTDDRIKIIEDYIQNTQNLGLVNIDGVRDLVHDFNNLHECTDLLNKLMGWVDTKNCHISLALHVNPVKKGDERKPRGHLGTELQNKVESSVIVRKNPELREMSLIEPRDFRSIDIKEFGLKVDSFGIPYLVEVENNGLDF